jgi:hypothetical protein
VLFTLMEPIAWDTAYFGGIDIIIEIAKRITQECRVLGYLLAAADLRS